MTATEARRAFNRMSAKISLCKRSGYVITSTMRDDYRSAWAAYRACCA